ncbi:hypothetical protein [Streptomyces niveus]|uniref:hypothetical protein n=1 Tax=Streptomyces niveus TaxID=193462 RepID=UPI00149612FE|nr:hypothetical protein [Streptomyces niveus]
MAAEKPRPNPIVDAPATPAACQQDRDRAQGQGPANTQLAEARQHAAEQAATR